MAVLSDNARVQLWEKFMRENTDTVDILRADLRAAINDIDQWLSDNAATLNAAIPQPARGALSASQKARLFAYVMIRRWGDNV